MRTHPLACARCWAAMPPAGGKVPLAVTPGGRALCWPCASARERAYINGRTVKQHPGFMHALYVVNLCGAPLWRVFCTLEAPGTVSVAAIDGRGRVWDGRGERWGQKVLMQRRGEDVLEADWVGGVPELRSVKR